ncbi:MAG: hypothetical protein Q8L01_00870 [Candidatus Woesebacteria bacterium]|nr:hypothetical protein [Candidatus Woesebacteria bacterium]
MENDTNKPSRADLSDFVSSLQKAKDKIPKSKAILKDKQKPHENYLICRDGIVAETDQTDTEKSKTIIKETKG